VHYRRVTTTARSAGVLGTRRFPAYKDIPGERYHYPKQRYQRTIEELVGALVLCYEPRRGGLAPDSSGGGRMAFVAMGFLDRWEDDAEDATHAYAVLRYFLEFPSPVPQAAIERSPKAFQQAVLHIDYDKAEHIVKLGLAVTSPSPDARIGYADADELITSVDRPLIERVQRRPVRDAAFRLHVVERAYAGRCALTGIRMTNGLGRAEADAAHIKPVDKGGPDTVRNGIALTKSMHWAFDRGLISLTDSGEILLVDRGLDNTFLRLLPESRQAHLPRQEEQRPHSAFLSWHRINVFKGSSAA
jgi:putative restriction endonuclease